MLQLNGHNSVTASPFKLRISTACSDGGLQHGISAYRGSDVVVSKTSSFASHFNASIVSATDKSRFKRSSSSSKMALLTFAMTLQIHSFSLASDRNDTLKYLEDIYIIKNNAFTYIL